MSAKRKQESFVERRRAPRRPIVDALSFFASVPKKGPFRLKVHDVSEIGIGFDIDLGGEGEQAFPVRVGEALDLQFYLNQSLYVPLSIRVARIEERADKRMVGAEFAAESAKSLTAMATLVRLIDQLQEIATVVGNS